MYVCLFQIQTIAVIKNHLVVYGGTTGWEYTSDIHRVDLQTGHWEELYPTDNSRPTRDEPPQARYRHEMMCDGERLYVLGGGNSGTTFSLDTVSFTEQVFNFSLRDFLYKRIG